MDFLAKYAAVISTTIDGMVVARHLKNEKLLNMTAYLTLLYMEKPDDQAFELVEMLIQQNNTRGIARLFHIIQKDYKELASTIPELSYGERFSVNLGGDVFLKVLVNDGEVTIDIRDMQVCVYS